MLGDKVEGAQKNFRQKFVPPWARFLWKCIFFSKLGMMYNAQKTQFPHVLKTYEGVSN